MLANAGLPEGPPTDKEGNHSGNSAWGGARPRVGVPQVPQPRGPGGAVFWEVLCSSGVGSPAAVERMVCYSSEAEGCAWPPGWGCGVRGGRGTGEAPGIATEAEEVHRKCGGELFLRFQGSDR